jgi:hypothetical protein
MKPQPAPFFVRWMDALARRGAGLRAGLGRLRAVSGPVARLNGPPLCSACNVPLISTTSRHSHNRYRAPSVLACERCGREWDLLRSDKDLGRQTDRRV